MAESVDRFMRTTTETVMVSLSLLLSRSLALSIVRDRVNVCVDLIL